MGDFTDIIPKISIVVANATENWVVEKTINSIKSQDYPAFEIIIPETETLNEAMAMARGEYICFFEAGDIFMSKDALGILVRTMEDSEEEGMPGDILVSNGYVINRYGDKRPFLHGCSENEDVYEYKFRFEGFFSKGYLSKLWGKVYRRSFIKKNKLEFSHIEYGAEMLFAFFAHANEPTYVFCDEAVYGKVERPYFAYEANCKEANYLQIAADFENYIRKMGNHPEYLDMCAYTIFFGIYSCAANMFSAGAKSKDVHEMLKRCRANDRIMRYVNWLAAGRYIRKLNHRTYRTMVPILCEMFEAKRYHILTGAVKRFMKNDRVRRI